MNECVKHWVAELISGKKIYKNGRVHEWMSEGVNEQVDKWKNERVNEWMSEWISRWMRSWLCELLSKRVCACMCSRHIIHDIHEWTPHFWE